MPTARSEVFQDTDALDPRIWRMAGVVILGPLMTSLDSTVVNVSLARLGQELHAPLTTIQWVITGYLLALALVLPVSGWLVDRIGAKKLYLYCFAGFTTASMLCGLASGAATLIGARVLQGVAGGLLAPMAQMMVAREAGRHLAKVMGIMVMPILLGPICGPVLAGFILQHGSWRWIFFINLPVGILAILLATWLLPRDEPREARRPFDFLGFALLSPGLVLLLHSLEQLSSRPAARGLNVLELAASLALLAGFRRRGLDPSGHPLLDLKLFRVPSFAAAAGTQFMANAIAYGGQMLMPLYLLTVRNLTPSQAGMVLIPGGLGAFCSYPLMGFMTGRFGSRRVSTGGALLSLLGTLPFAWAGAALPAWAIGLALFLRGAGLGGISIPSLAAAYAGLPKSEIPVATTALNIVQRMGGPVATTLLAIFLHLAMVHAGPGARAFSATFGFLCLLHATAVLAALRLPWSVQHTPVG